MTNNDTTNTTDTDLIIQGLNKAAAWAVYVAKSKGFHDDEETVSLALSRGLADLAEDGVISLDQADEYQQWFRDQVLQAEQARVMSETAEGVENVRKGRGPDDKLPEYEGWVVEAIDDIIRNLDMLGKRGVKPGEVLVAKLQYNQTRPFKHGKQS